MPPTSRRRIGLGCVARMVTPWQVYNFLARVRFRSTQVSRFLGKTQAEKGWDPDRLPPKFQAWLRSLRLLSRNFYTMITPHLYKEFDLSGDKQIRNFVGSQSPVLEIVKVILRILLKSENFFLKTRRADLSARKTFGNIQNRSGFLTELKNSIGTQ